MGSLGMKSPKDHPKGAQVCPVLHQPFADCYCMNISSANINKMLTLCIGDYRSCPIYQRQLEDADSSSLTDTRDVMSLTNFAKE